MSVSSDKLKADRITFYSACRENTGAHFLDSGGAYGRHHEAPEIDPSTTPSVRWDPDMGCTLSTPHYLDAGWEIDRELQGAWEAYDAVEGEDLNWFESGAAFMESRGYEPSMRGNPYNQDNDLSQVFVFEVWNLKPDDGDNGIYTCANTVTVFYVHNGCDVSFAS